MKMIAEDYQLLDSLVKQILDYNRKPTGQTRTELITHLEAGLVNKRGLRKDPAGAAASRIYEGAVKLANPFTDTWFGGQPGFGAKLYQYLTDAHIATAMRKIIRDIIMDDVKAQDKQEA